MSLFLVLLVSFVLVMQATGESAAGEARVHGFFVQPYLGYGATDYKSFSSQGEYDSWVQSMADVGAEMLFTSGQFTMKKRRRGSVMPSVAARMPTSPSTTQLH